MRDDSVLPFVLALTVTIVVFAGLAGGVTADGGSIEVQGDNSAVQTDSLALDSGVDTATGVVALGAVSGVNDSAQRSQSGEAHATVEVTGLEADTVVVEWGSTIALHATVTNTGEEQTTQDVVFAVDGTDLLETQTVTLDGGVEKTVEFAGIDTAEIDTEGHYQFTVSSDDDTRSGTLVVENPGPPVLFEVSDIDIETVPESVNLTEYEDVNVAATVTNTGTQRGTQTIEFQVDNATIDETELTLSDGESERVAFTRTDVNHTLDQEYRYSIASMNDEVAGTLVLETPADDDERTDDSGTDNTADDDGSGFGFSVTLLAFLVATLIAVSCQRYRAVTRFLARTIQQ